MANSVYFRNCIRGIRQGVFGRDNRKPIADAIEMLVYGNQPRLDELVEMRAKLNACVHVVSATPLMQNDEYRLVFTRLYEPNQ